MSVLEPDEFEKIVYGQDFGLNDVEVENLERQFRVNEAQKPRKRGLRKTPMFLGVTTDAQTCKWCEGEIEAKSRHFVTRHGPMHEACFERWDLIDKGENE